MERLGHLMIALTTFWFGTGSIVFATWLAEYGPPWLREQGSGLAIFVPTAFVALAAYGAAAYFAAWSITGEKPK